MVEILSELRISNPTTFDSALAVVLLHSLWQILFIVAISSSALQLLKKCSANVRYIVACTTLFSMPIICCVTLLIEIRPESANDTDPNYVHSVAASVMHHTRTPNDVAAQSTRTDESIELPASSADEDAPRLTWITSRAIVTTYLVGVCLMLLRILIQLHRAEQTRRAAKTELTPLQKRLVADLSRRLRLAVVPVVALCERVTVPCVIGVVRPVVLIPVSVATGLTNTELESILLHELAHIRRRDLILSLAQRIVEAFFFYHPAVWWLSRQIDFEREAACDDLAIATGNSNTAYVQSLVRVAEISLSDKRHRQLVSLAAIGDHSSQLTRRIERLLGVRRRSGNRAFTLLLIASVIFAICGRYSYSTFAQSDPEVSHNDTSQLSADAVVEHRMDVNGTTISAVETLSDDELKATVRNIIRQEFEYKPGRGTWQLGSYEAGLSMSLHLINQPERVANLLIDDLENANDLTMTQRRVALRFAASHAANRLVPFLVKRINVPFLNRNGLDRWTEIETLGFVGPKAKPALSTLYRLLKSSSLGTRQAAMEAITKIAPHSAEAAAEISQLLNEPNDKLRSSAVYQLGRYGPIAKPVGTKIEKLLSDGSRDVQIWAAWSLITTQYDSKRGFETLLEFVANGTPEHRGIAATALAALGSRSSHIMDELRRFENDADDHVAREIKQALQRINDDDRIKTHSETADEIERQRAKWRKAMRGLANEGAKRSRTPAEILDTRITISLNNVTIEDAIKRMASEANVDVSVDSDSLRKVGVNVVNRVSLDIKSESLSTALSRVIPWAKHFGSFYEAVGQTLYVSTLDARNKRINALLPDWLKPMHGNGLVANVDGYGTDANVVALFIGNHASDAFLAKLATLPNLQHLEMTLTEQVTQPGLQHLGQLKQLKKISLHGGADYSAGFGDNAIESISELPKLNDLEIIECGITDAGAMHLERITQLTNLRIYQEGRLTDASLEPIGKLKNLEQLDLTSRVATAAHGFMEFSADGLRHLAPLKNLRVLHLAGHEVTPESLAFPGLTSLSVGRNSVDDACAKSIAKLKQLKTLNLSYTRISDAGLAYIGTLNALQRIDIDSSVITDGGIAKLCNLPLRSIALRASGVSDKTIEHLSKIKTLERIDLHGSGRPGAVTGSLMSIEAMQQLSTLPKLHTLWLTNFNSGGGSYLPLSKIKQLQNLTLMMCDIREDDYRALEQQLPKTVIHHMTGGGGFSRMFQ